MTAKRERVALLDLLRGIAMLYVMLYHAVYDLKFMYHKDIPDLITPGNDFFEALHVFFLWILFAVSGICSGYSRNPLKRGVVLYIIGWGITAATALVMPSQLIVFGVISCFGACMSITALIRKLLDKIPWPMLFTVSFLLWVLFSDFHSEGVLNLVFTKIPLALPVTDQLYQIGITSPDFYSSDYFPIIPFIFMYTAGIALYRPLTEKKLPEKAYTMKTGVIGFIGKHSLIFYAAHQPLFLVLFELIF